jgi:predicted nucleotide-binding protein
MRRIADAGQRQKRERARLSEHHGENSRGSSAIGQDGNQRGQTPSLELRASRPTAGQELYAVRSGHIIPDARREIRGRRLINSGAMFYMKPKVFIGSSTEGREIAEAIHARLQPVAECTVWTERVFGLSESNMQSLLRRLHTSEFGVFVFSPDDVTTMRGKLLSVPRDNVVFELGLFSGALGPERCFFAVPTDIDIHLPSDLLGITAGRYETGRSDNNLEAAVSVFCSKVLTKIREDTLSLTFVDIEPNAPLHTYKTGGKHTFTCECNRQPPDDVFVLVNRGNLWWPQPTRPQRTFSGRHYQFDCWFGATGSHTIHVVKARSAARVLIEYYFNVIKKLEENRAKLRRMSLTETQLKDLQPWYPPISLDELPQDLFSIADVAVQVVPSPA